jgi:hypothetical protein
MSKNPTGFSSFLYNSRAREAWAFSKLLVCGHCAILMGSCGMDEMLRMKIKLLENKVLCGMQRGFTGHGAHYSQVEGAEDSAGQAHGMIATIIIMKEGIQLLDRRRAMKKALPLFALSLLLLAGTASPVLGRGRTDFRNFNTNPPLVGHKAPLFDSVDGENDRCRRPGQTSPSRRAAPARSRSARPRGEGP